MPKISRNKNGLNKKNWNTCQQPLPDNQIVDNYMIGLNFWKCMCLLNIFDIFEKNNTKNFGK